MWAYGLGFYSGVMVGAALGSISTAIFMAYVAKRASTMRRISSRYNDFGVTESDVGKDLHFKSPRAIVMPRKVE